MQLFRANHHLGFARNVAESAHPELWTGLRVVYAPVLGNTGSLVLDYSGKRNNGSQVGLDASTDWTHGQFGSQLDFVGDGQYIDFSGVDLGGNKGTVVLWLKPDFAHIQSSPFAFLPFGTASSTSIYFYIRYNGASSSRRYEALMRGNFGNVLTISNGTQYGSDAELQVWTCLAFTWDIDNSEYYILRDGMPYGSDTVTSVTAWGGNTDWRLGDNANAGTSWTGAIAECLVYDRVISNAELKKLAIRPGMAFQKREWSVGMVSAAAVGGNIPVFMNHYRQQGFV